MAIQQIINISNQLTIDRRKVVGVQYSRSQIQKTDLTVTKNPWRFTISAPGQPYSTMRSTIEQLNTMDRINSETITFNNNSNLSWLFRYQGNNSTTPIGITVSSFTGNQLVLGSLPSMSSALYLFRAGDIVQITGKPYPFTIIQDVLRGSGSTVTVTTHRPNIITTSVAGLTIVVGSAVQFSVFCPNMPTYHIIPGAYSSTNGGIVEWDDSFQLYENLAGA